MADLRDQQMPFQRRITADLEVRQSQFGLLILQATFDRPAAEGDVQQDGQGDAGPRVAHEEFPLVAVQHVASDDQPVRSDHAVAARQPARGELDFPNLRSLVGVLDVTGLPGLAQERS